MTKHYTTPITSLVPYLSETKSCTHYAGFSRKLEGCCLQLFRLCLRISQKLSLTIGLALTIYYAINYSCTTQTFTIQNDVLHVGKI